MTNSKGVFEATYDANSYVSFSKSCLHPEIGDIDIGRFSDSRSKDMSKYLGELKQRGFDAVPKGYDVHHTPFYEKGTMQLVADEWHSLFTHRGGFSLANH